MKNNMRITRRKVFIENELTKEKQFGHYKEILSADTFLNRQLPSKDQVVHKIEDLEKLKSQIQKQIRDLKLAEKSRVFSIYLNKPVTRVNISSLHKSLNSLFGHKEAAPLLAEFLRVQKVIRYHDEPVNMTQLKMEASRNRQNFKFSQLKQDHTAISRNIELLTQEFTNHDRSSNCQE